MKQTSEFSMQALGAQARAAARVLRSASGSAKAQALLAMASAIEREHAWLQAENQRDLEQAAANDLAPALIERLRLSDKALQTMVAGLRQIAAMDDPIGATGAARVRPNGMRVARMRVPIGVIGIIYESRPNVTIDAAALCLKSGNATILRGGSEAFHSNQALGAIIVQGLQAANLPAHAVQLLPSTDRALVDEMITLTESIDVIIPRGGKGLIARLSERARVPLLKHLDGNCHIYVDSAADLDMALEVVANAKTYRCGICGAVETVLVHAAVAGAWLPRLGARMAELGVELRACPQAQALLPGSSSATPDDWAEEFLAPILAVRVVADIDQAMEHIEEYGSGHTESIITGDLARARLFQNQVDSSSVFVNLPTCFADGFEYGLGAEIGISTNRLHARGPVGLEGLTIEKWLLEGSGQLRG